MQFKLAFVASALVAATSVAAAPAPISPSGAQIRACPSATVVESLDNVLTKILPELKPLLDGVTGLEDNLGAAVPLLGSLLKFLDDNCL